MGAHIRESEEPSSESNFRNIVSTSASSGTILIVYLSPVSKRPSNGSNFSSFQNTENRVVLNVAEQAHRNANADVGPSSEIRRNVPNVWRGTGGCDRGQKLMNACSLLKIELF